MKSAAPWTWIRSPSPAVGTGRNSPPRRSRFATGEAGAPPLMAYTRAHALLFLAPLLLIVLVMYGMMAWTVAVSLDDWVGMAPVWKYHGLENFRTLLGGALRERLFTSLRNNLIWLVVFIAPTTALGLFLAYGLDLVGPAERVLRPLFLYPIALSFVVSGTLWAWMYDPDAGVINNLFRMLGLGRWAQPWIADPHLATFCLVGAAVWQYTGFAMTLYLAAIRDMPREIFEAARVDGATDVQTFRHVVIPNVGHATMIVVAMLWLLPLYVVLANSLKAIREITQSQYVLPPAGFEVQNYAVALGVLRHGLVNSTLVALPATALAVLLGSGAGFFLARLRFRHSQAVFFAATIATFLPYQIVLIPLTQLLADLRLINTRPGLIVAYLLLNTPMAALITATFFQTVPAEMHEAAALDGCGPVTFYSRILLPVAQLGLLSTAILILTTIRNELLLPTALTQGTLHHPAPPELA